MNNENNDKSTGYRLLMALIGALYCGLLAYLYLIKSNTNNKINLPGDLIYIGGSIIFFFILGLFKKAFIEKYKPEIIGGAVATLFVNLLIKETGLTLIGLDIVLGVGVAYIYGLHNKLLLKRFDQTNRTFLDSVEKKYKDIIDPISNNIENIKTLFPIYDVLIKMPKFFELGEKIRPLLGKFDEQILNYILKEQISLLNGKERIMSLNTYLEILNQFGSEYSTLYCINKTLPIYWFSPLKAEREFVTKYAEDTPKKKITIYRLTRVDNKKRLLSQFEDAFDIVSKQGKDEVIQWCLVLLQRIYDNDENKIVERLTENLPTDYQNELKSIILENRDSGRIDSALLDGQPNDIKSILIKNIRSIKDNSRNSINKRINNLFVEENKTDGSFYVSNNRLKLYFQKEMRIEEHGEYGVYLKKNNIPERAFATIGEFGSLIRIEIWDEPKDIYDNLRKLVDNIKNAREKSGRDQGNMEFLYEGV